MIVDNNSFLLENVYVVFKILDSSFLASDVFLGNLEHVLQFLEREFFVHLRLVFDLFGSLAESQGRSRFVFVVNGWGAGDDQRSL